jgi:hypothetical protein
MARCGCSSACSCAVIADPTCELASVSGNGQVGTPYAICVNPTTLIPQDTASVNMHIEGTGVPSDPYVISADSFGEGASGAYLQANNTDEACTEVLVTGVGSFEDPYQISSEVVLSPATTSCSRRLECTPIGLRFREEEHQIILGKPATQTCVFGGATGSADQEQVTWTSTIRNVGTALSAAGSDITVMEAGLYLIHACFRAIIDPPGGAGQHMANFNILINGVRSGGVIMPYGTVHSHRAEAHDILFLMPGTLIQVEFADQAIGGVTPATWLLAGDVRNQFNVTQLQGQCA